MEAEDHPQENRKRRHDDAKRKEMNEGMMQCIVFSLKFCLLDILPLPMRLEFDCIVR